MDLVEQGVCARHLSVQRAKYPSSERPQSLSPKLYLQSSKFFKRIKIVNVPRAAQEPHVGRIRPAAVGSPTPVFIVVCT